MEASVGRLMAVRVYSGWLHPRGGQEAMHGTISEPSSCLPARLYSPRIPQHLQTASPAGDQVFKHELVRTYHNQTITVRICHTQEELKRV